MHRVTVNQSDRFSSVPSLDRLGRRGYTRDDSAEILFQSVLREAIASSYWSVSFSRSNRMRGLFIRHLVYSFTLSAGGHDRRSRPIFSEFNADFCPLLTVVLGWQSSNFIFFFFFLRKSFNLSITFYQNASEKACNETSLLAADSLSSLHADGSSHHLHS